MSHTYCNHINHKYPLEFDERLKAQQSNSKWNWKNSLWPCQNNTKNKTIQIFPQLTLMRCDLCSTIDKTAKKAIQSIMRDYCARYMLFKSTFLLHKYVILIFFQYIYSFYHEIPPKSLKKVSTFCCGVCLYDVRLPHSFIRFSMANKNAIASLCLCVWHTLCFVSVSSPFLRLI